MGLSGFPLVFHRISTWIMRLAYLNLLWMGFTLLGGILFGFGPALVALFSVWRKMLLGEEVSIFSFFWHSYKSNFLKGNFFILIFGGFGLLLSLDLSFFKQANGLLSDLSFGFFILFLLLYVMSIIYIFPVYVHYQLNLWGYMKYSVLIALYSPFHTLSIIAGLFCVFVVETFIPGLYPFFCTSLPCLLIMYICNLSFSNIAREREFMVRKETRHEI